MKSSLWFEASMLALILVVSIVSVAAKEAGERRVPSDNGKTAQLQTPANYPIPKAYW